MTVEGLRQLINLLSEHAKQGVWERKDLSGPIAEISRLLWREAERKGRLALGDGLVLTVGEHKETGEKIWKIGELEGDGGFLAQDEEEIRNNQPPFIMVGVLGDIISYQATRWEKFQESTKMDPSVFQASTLEAKLDAKRRKDDSDK